MDSMSNTQKLSICLIWMWDAVWCGFHPQPWHNHIIWLHMWPRNPKSEPSWVGIPVYGWYFMPMDSILMCSNTLYMSNIDVGSSLRCLSASAVTQSHHFDSTSDPEPKNLSQVGWVWLCKADTVCPWTAYKCAQTLCICVIWIWEVVWGGCQPQPWHNHIIFLTPQVTQNPKIWPSRI